MVDLARKLIKRLAGLFSEKPETLAPVVRVPVEETGVSLRLVLKRRGLTQRELAYALDKPESSVNRWCRGAVPRAANQKEIVEFLNTGSDFVLTTERIWGGK